MKRILVLLLILTAFIQAQTGTKTIAKFGVDKFAIADSTWDDLVISATLINPAGSPAPPAIDNTDGSLLFDAAGVETVIGIFQIPHCYLAGSDIVFHIHWAKSTSATGNVTWQMKYKWANIGATLPAFSSLTAGVRLTTDNNTADENQLTSWTALSGTGKTLSSILIVYLERTGTDGGDTYGADAKLFSFDVHYRKDSNGSSQQTVK